MKSRLGEQAAEDGLRSRRLPRGAALMGRSILSIVCGLAVVMAGVIIATMITAKIMFGSVMPDPALRPPQSYLVVNLLYSALFAVLGGYVTAYVVRRRELLHATILAAALFVLGVGSLIAPDPRQPLWYLYLISIIGVGGAILGGALRGRGAVGVKSATAK